MSSRSSISEVHSRRNALTRQHTPLKDAQTRNASVVSLSGSELFEDVPLSVVEPLERKSLPIDLDTVDPLSYPCSFAHREREEEDSRRMCPCFKRRIFASCISTYSKKVILKLWLIRILFAFGMALSSAAFLQVIINEDAKPSTLAFYGTMSSSINAAIDVFLMSPRSHYADVFGRKKVLFVSFLSYAVTKVILAVHATIMTGMIVSVIPTIFSIYGIVIGAITADVLPTRPKIIAQINTYESILTAGSAGIGFMAGTGMIRVLDVPLYSLFIMTVCILFLDMFVVSTLPETLDVDKVIKSRKTVVISKDLLNALEDEKPFTWNVFKSIRAHFRVIHKDKRVMWLLYCGFVLSIGNAGGLSQGAAFLMEQLGWTIEELFIAAVVGGVCATISGLCSGQLIKWMGAPVLMKISLPYSILLMVALAFVNGYYYFYALVLLSIPLGPQFSAARSSYITSIVPTEYQTRIKGANSMLSKVAIACFANLYSLAFLHFTSDKAYFPGAVILIGAFVRSLAIPFLLKAPIWNKEHLEDAFKRERILKRRASCPV